MSKAPEFSDTKELLYVRILDPEIYISPGGRRTKGKGGARRAIGRANHSV